nr:PMR5 N-terminal domain, PC-esterase, trichome birefringence-like family [Tanacetum cinerariifolium]
MLVESNGDSPTDHHRNERIFRINAIEKHARHWVDADILIFNSYHWWRLPVVKILKKAGSLLDAPNQEYEEVNYLRAYKMGLKTWSKWARTHIDRSKTKLFFMGATATHLAAREWGGKDLATCYGETEPETNSTLVGYGIDRKMLSILESTLKKLEAKGLNVQIINITQLTQYRKDGHTSIYKKKWRPLTELETKRPENAADCSHWCLPGVPDIWNELLLAYILQ